MLARPAKVYDFTAFARRQPTTPPPGDRIDAQLQNHADAITAVQLAVEKLIAAQTKPTTSKIKALAAEIKLSPKPSSATSPARPVTPRRSPTRRSFSSSACSLKRIARATSPIAQRRAWRRRCSKRRRAQAPTSATSQGSRLARRCPPLVMAQAVFTPATTPARLRCQPTTPRSRSNGPSTCPTPSRPTSWRSIRSPASIGRPAGGRCAPPMRSACWPGGTWARGPARRRPRPSPRPAIRSRHGGMYFDTDLGIMLVWNGSSWVPLAQGAAAATTASLYYHATAGQTVFPLSAADRYGHTFAFNQTTTEGLLAPHQRRAPGAHRRLHRRHCRLERHLPAALWPPTRS